MKPILPSSLKSTALPKDLTDEIRELLEQEFQDNLSHCVIIAEGRIYAEEIHLRIGYRPEGQLTQYNFEFAGLYQKKEQVEERIKKFLDLSTGMIQDHIAADADMDLPRQWKKLDDDTYMQYSTVNTDLEAEADRLLALDQSDLIRDELDVADPLDQAFMVDDPDVLTEVYKKFREKESKPTVH